MLFNRVLSLWKGLGVAFISQNFKVSHMHLSQSLFVKTSIVALFSFMRMSYFVFYDYVLFLLLLIFVFNLINFLSFCYFEYTFHVIFNKFNG